MKFIRCTFLLMAMSLLVLGCVFDMYNLTPPIPQDIENSKTFSSSFDKVWTATVQTFAELNLDIATIEKDSGIIVSNYFLISNEERYIHKAKNEYCDCGTAELLTEHYRKVKFNVFLKELAGESIEVRVNAVFENRTSRPTGGLDSVNSCVSTGKFESEIFKLIGDRI